MSAGTLGRGNGMCTRLEGPAGSGPGRGKLRLRDWHVQRLLGQGAGMWFWVMGSHGGSQAEECQV